MYLQRHLVTGPIFGLALCATAAVAQESAHPWYVGIDLSLGQFGDSDVSGSADGEISYDPTVTISGIKVGYRPTAMFSEKAAARFELELGGRFGSIDEQTGTTAGRDDNIFGVGVLMANAYYDFRPTANFSPYIGAGFGAAAGFFDKNPGFGITDKETNESVLAGQLMAGVSYQHENWEHVRLTAGYRYFRTDDMKFEAKGKKDVEIEGISSHELVVGFAYHF